MNNVVIWLELKLKGFYSLSESVGKDAQREEIVPVLSKLKEMWVGQGRSNVGEQRRPDKVELTYLPKSFA